MSTSYGDASTVVGGADHHHLKHAETSKEARRTHHAIQNNFVDNVDYALKERAFFVPIGKDGVIAALEKLDTQLVQVSLLFHNLSPQLTICSREETEFYRQRQEYCILYVHPI